MSTPIAGALAVTPLYRSAADAIVWWDDPAQTWSQKLAAGAGAGTVTSIAAGVGITVSPSPITASGTVGLTIPVAVGSGGTGTATVMTAGSVVFAGASGVYAQDNANLFWDDGNNRLGIGTTTPNQRLDVNGAIAIRSSAILDSDGVSTGSNRLLDTSSGFAISANGNGGGSANQIFYYGNSHTFFNKAQSATYMVANATGLGIGAAPSQKLDVYGNIAISGGTRLSGDGTNTILTDPAAGYGVLVTTGIINHYASTHTFYNKAGSATKLVLDASGNAVVTGTLACGGSATVTATYAAVHMISPGQRDWLVGSWPDSTFMLWDQTGSIMRMQVVAGNGYCYNATGTWNAISDLRTKKAGSIADYAGGLAEVVKLRPVSFEYNGLLGTADDGTTQYGFIAQEVEQVLPELVGELAVASGPDAPPDKASPLVKTVNPTATVYALVNAVKELAARVAQLEMGST